MNRWSEANIEENPDWKLMLEGNPLRSSYSWMAILFTAGALFGMFSVISSIYWKHELVVQWTPVLLGVLYLMGITADGAIRAISHARLEAARGICSGASERRAFQKFRIYSLFAAISAIVLVHVGFYL